MAMKASELIAALQDIQSRFGDFEVFVIEPMDERDALEWPLVELDVDTVEGRIELTYDNTQED